MEGLEVRHYVREAAVRQKLEASGRVKEARARALDITYAEYEGQVFEFLGEEARRQYATELAWDDMRLAVVTLIERVLERQEHQ
jgi:hypothetical protein